MTKIKEGYTEVTVMVRNDILADVVGLSKKIETSKGEAFGIALQNGVPATLVALEEGILPLPDQQTSDPITSAG